MPEDTGDGAVWSVAQYDTIPAIEFWHNPLETHIYLAAFLNSAESSFSPPYNAVREAIARHIQELEVHGRRGQRPSPNVVDQRLRTWRKVFESFGLLRVDETNTTRLTRLGERLSRLNRELNDYLEGANDQLAELAVETRRTV